MRYLSILLVLLLCCSWAGAQEPKEDEKFNVDFVLGWGGNYRPGEWTPVELRVYTKLADPFAGVARIKGQQDGLTNLHIVHNFVVQRDMPYKVTLATKLAVEADECEVSITDSKGRRQWRGKYGIYDPDSDRSLLTPLQQGDLLVGVVGNQPPQGLHRLRSEARSVHKGGYGDVYIASKLPGAAPWDWTGYAALDLLIVYNVDWNTINTEHQVRAIVEWVENGGNLLIIPGGNPIPGNHPIRGLLPFELGDMEKRALHWPESLTRYPRNIGIGGIGGRVFGAADVWRLELPENSNRCQSVMEPHGKVFFAWGPSGFGNVGVLPVSPSLLRTGVYDPANFWCNTLALMLGEMPTPPEITEDDQNRFRPHRDYSDRLARRNIEYVGPEKDEVATGQGQYYSGYYQFGATNQALNSIQGHLLSIPELRPLSIWWVIGLLSLLTLLIGPVDYFVLKKMDRQPLTWVTASGWIILFTVGAYFGVEALRGGNLQLRAVSIQDSIAGGPTFTTTYSGVFAPKTARYTLTNLGEKQWWASITPTSDNMYYHRGGVASRNLYCMQQDGGNVPYATPISIWSMQCFMTEAAEGGCPLDAQVTVGEEWAEVTVTNHAEQTALHVGVWVSPTEAINVGSIPPGSTVTRERRPKSVRGWQEGRPHVWHPQEHDVYFAQGTVKRTRGVMRQLDSGAACVCAFYEEAPAPYGVKINQSNTDHMRLVRHVVYPTVSDEWHEPEADHDPNEITL